MRERELVRGALLHDYFLYDWHTRKSAKGLKELHGFSHPETALRNAGRDYRLTPCERGNYPEAHVAAHGRSAHVPGGVDCDGGG